MKKINIEDLIIGDIVNVPSRRNSNYDIWLLLVDVIFAKEMDEYINEDNKYEYIQTQIDYWKTIIHKSIEKPKYIIKGVHIVGGYSGTVWCYPDSVIVKIKKNKHIHKIFKKIQIIYKKACKKSLKESLYLTLCSECRFTNKSIDKYPCNNNCFGRGLHIHWMCRTRFQKLTDKLINWWCKLIDKVRNNDDNRKSWNNRS